MSSPEKTDLVNLEDPRGYGIIARRTTPPQGAVFRLEATGVEPAVVGL